MLFSNCPTRNCWLAPKRLAPRWPWWWEPRFTAIATDEVLRNCLGILRFAKDYGAEALESAAGRALDANAISYRALEGFLRAPKPQRLAPPPPIDHENIRGASYFEEVAC